jgi:hypothetical protein
LSSMLSDIYDTQTDKTNFFFKSDTRPKIYSLPENTDTHSSQLLTTLA